MKSNVEKREERGGVLVWSLLMMTMIVALVTFAIETFRLTTALSQQHDSAQFAAEAALADLRKCLKETEAYPANNVNCLTRASQVAKEVIKSNVLVGAALATNSDDIIPTFYNC
jgi:Tfp pilus assembly protein PilX